MKIFLSSIHMDKMHICQVLIETLVSNPVLSSEAIEGDYIYNNFAADQLSP